MDLMGIENSKVVNLMNLFRPAGQLYDAEAAAKIVGRYSFLKYPTLENLLKNERTFSAGKFQDVQITEFSIYSDGMIATSASDTDIIDAFIDDIIGWATSEFGLVPVVGFPPERSYESSLLVKSDVDLAKALAPKNDIAAIVNRVYQSDRYDMNGEMKYTGFCMSTDHTEFKGRRKPVSFIVDRRVGLPFDQGIYYSTAPLRTKDHLKVLSSLERLARGAE